MRVKEKWLPKLASLNGEPSDRWGIVVESDHEHWIILPSNLLDQQDVGLICATHNNALQGARSISVGAVITEEMEPFVEMTVGTESIQMTISQARVQLRVLQEETEAAIAEAMLTKLFNETLGFEAAASALRRFREMRLIFNAPIIGEGVSDEHNGR